MKNGVILLFVALSYKMSFETFEGTIHLCLTLKTHLDPMRLTDGGGGTRYQVEFDSKA